MQQMIFSLKKINILRLYLISIIGIVISLPLFILIPFILKYFFSDFSDVAFIHIILAFIIGSFSYKYAVKKSLSELIIRLSKSEFSIGEKTINKNDIKEFNIDKKTSYYPRITIIYLDNKTCKFRVDKNEDFESLNEKLKIYRYY